VGSVVKLSVIVSTRDRAPAIGACLDSIAVAFSKASPLDAEIVVIDNGSTDNTAEVVKAWANANVSRLQLLHEPKQGLSRAHNRALDHARGEILAFTDDDCRLHPQYVNDLLRYDAADRTLVVRGGRVELGDAADLPLTINTHPKPIRWTRKERSARRERLCGCINGCNMVMRRNVVDLVGRFSVLFGPGSYVGSGSDCDLLFRAYTAGVTIEYVPDMTVFHCHGRKTYEEGRKLMRRYMIGSGALFARYLLKDPDLCRVFYRDFRDAAVGLLTGKNQWQVISHRERVLYTLHGAVRYMLRPREEDDAHNLSQR
jgi:glycosyltransferase involved in cell wall biosynthesis